MDKKRIMSFILLLSFLIATTPTISFAEDSSYSINQANIDLFVQQNGMLHVNEKYNYTFTGTSNEVYRDIPLQSGEDIQNIKITADGAYLTYEIISDGNVKTIKVYLYSNPQKTIPLTKQNIEVTIKYDLIHAITIYNDIGALNYNLWGEYRIIDVEKINAQIHLPSSNGVNYWFKPPYYIQKANFNDSTLQIETKKISHRNYLKLIMGIPLNNFNNPIYAQKLNRNGLAEINKIQKDYQDKINYDAFIYELVAFLMILSIIIPIYIYLRYGREPKIAYNAQYEHEPPSNDPPVVINAISGKEPGKIVGTPDMDGFLATIMDLINREYIILSEVDADTESLELKINPLKSLDDLYKYETDLIDILSKYKVKDHISLDKMKKDLKDGVKARSFKDKYDLWKKEVKSEFFSDNNLEKFYIITGDKYMEKYGAVAILVAVAVFFRSACDIAPYAFYGMIGSLILGLTGILAFILPYKIAGRWTEYGMEYNAHWQSFKRFINDFSLIKDQPLESVALWNQYLVYATALGVADEVRDIMDNYLPEEFRESNIYVFHSHGGYHQMSHALNSGMDTAAKVSSNEEKYQK